MKKPLLGLLALFALSACQTTGGLKPGEIMGTDIGSQLADEAGLSLSLSQQNKMNDEIDKALYFSDDGLTTRWYAGYNARLRPTGEARNRRDRVCRHFRHGHMINDQWFNGSATACRENNVAWYLIANQWDRNPKRYNNNDRRDRDWDRGDYRKPQRGKWDNLSGELGSGGQSTRW